MKHHICNLYKYFVDYSIIISHEDSENVFLNIVALSIFLFLEYIVSETHIPQGIIWLEIQNRWKCIYQKKHHLVNIHISIEFMLYIVTTKNVCWINLVFNEEFAFLSCCEKGHYPFYTLSALWLYIKILWGSWKYVDNR